MSFGPYVIGVDIGPNSIGATAMSESGQLMSIVSHLHPDYGVPTEKGFVSPCADRRIARLARRTKRRKKRRVYVLSRVLEGAGILGPKGSVKKDPYLIRTEALDAVLPPHEVGVAIMHLAHRRGYVEAVKQRGEATETKDGEVMKSIQSIRLKIAEGNFRTIGEWLNSLPKHDRKRNRYVHRQEVMDELDAIWTSQQRYSKKIFTDALLSRIKTVVFYQRRIKSCHENIGRCEVYYDKVRAHACSWEAAEIRMLQEVSNMRVMYGSTDRSLTSVERMMVLGLCRNRGGSVDGQDPKKIMFCRVKSALVQEFNLPPDLRINLENGKRQSFYGQYVEWVLNDVFDDYHERPSFYRNLWNDTLSSDLNDTVAHCIENGVPRDLAVAMFEAFTDMNMSTDYSSYSSEALKRMLLFFQDGHDLTKVIKLAFPELKTRTKPVLDLLPPFGQSDLPPEILVEMAWGDPGNGVVTRALTEYRKVVNAIIRKFGKPSQITIELVREASMGLKKRNEFISEQRENERDREKAVAAIAKLGVKKSEKNIRKYRLWSEQGGICPYTGDKIELSDVFAEADLYQIDHVVPSSLGGHDRSSNLVLTSTATNRSKMNRTPYQVWGSDKEAWGEIEDRILGKKVEVEIKGKKKEVRRGGMLSMSIDRKKNIVSKANPKLDKEFKSRSLNDTGYIACLAVRYTKLLGVKVDVYSGYVTGAVRRLGKLHERTGMPSDKRSDARHHALDSFILAKLTPKVRKHLAEFLGWSDSWKATKPQEYAEAERNITQVVMECFDDSSVDQVKHALEDHAVMSVRPNRTVQAQFFDDSNYGVTRDQQLARSQPVRYLIKNKALDPKRMDRILDPTLQERISAHVATEQARLGESFNLEKALETIPARSGGFIRKVKMTSPYFKSENPVIAAHGMITEVKNNGGSTNLITSGNHHVAFYVTDRGKVEKWVRSSFHAAQAIRVNKGKKDKGVILDEHPEYLGSKLRLVLHTRDLIEFKDQVGKVPPGRYVVGSISGYPIAKSDEIKLYPVRYYKTSESEKHRIRWGGTLTAENIGFIKVVAPCLIGWVAEKYRSMSFSACASQA